MNQQPYQEAGDQIRKDKERFPNLLKSAAGTAIGVGAGAVAGSIASRALPLLNKYIPKEMAVKGLSKINPSLGKFAQMAFSSGFDSEEVGDFIKEKEPVSKEQKKQELPAQKNEPPKENRNVIEQYDPELHTYIKMKLGEGLSLLEAGKKALGHGRFKKAVDQLVKDHKTSWDAILKSVYGNDQMAQQPQRPEQIQQQPQQQETGAGQGQQKLMAILQQLQQSRGKK